MTLLHGIAPEQYGAAQVESERLGGWPVSNAAYARLPHCNGTVQGSRPNFARSAHSRCFKFRKAFDVWVWPLGLRF
jgi:hypothetical protein